MNNYLLLMALLSLILCISGVVGQYVQYPTSVGYTTPSPMLVGHYSPSPPSIEHLIQTSQANQTTDVSQYSQYYWMGSPTTVHITAPQQYAIVGGTPATYARGSSLWIKGQRSLTQYAAVPHESSVSLLAVTPKRGEGYITEIDPDGKTNNYNFYFYHTSQLGFYAEKSGRYVLSLNMTGQPSNQIIIDVIATYKVPSSFSFPSYYSGYYPYYWDYYPYYWDYYPYCWDCYPTYWDHHQGDWDHYQGGKPNPEPYPGEKPYYPEEKPYPDPYTGEIASFDTETGENLPYPMDDND